MKCQCSYLFSSSFFRFLLALIYKSQKLFCELPKLGDGESAVNKQIYAFSWDLWSLKIFLRSMRAQAKKD